MDNINQELWPVFTRKWKLNPIFFAIFQTHELINFNLEPINHHFLVNRPIRTFLGFCELFLVHPISFGMSLQEGVSWYVVVKARPTDSRSKLTRSIAWHSVEITKLCSHDFLTKFPWNQFSKDNTTMNRQVRVDFCFSTLCLI